MFKGQKDDTNNGTPTITNQPTETTQNTNTPTKEQKPDKLTEFMDSIKAETNIAFSEPEFAEMPEVWWVPGNKGLQLIGTQTMKVQNASSKDWQKVQQFFETRGATHGVGDMEYDAPNDKVVGYYFDKEGDNYMLMCILDNTDGISVSCGWGPGGKYY